MYTLRNFLLFLEDQNPIVFFYYLSTDEEITHADDIDSDGNVAELICRERYMCIIIPLFRYKILFLFVCTCYEILF